MVRGLGHSAHSLTLQKGQCTWVENKGSCDAQGGRCGPRVAEVTVNLRVGALAEE